MGRVLQRELPFLLLLSGLLVAALAVLREQVTPTPVSADASDSDFSSARALNELRYLLGDEAPHPIGSQANEQVRDRLIASLEAIGLVVETQQSVGCAPRWAVCGRVNNVLTEIPGEQRSSLLLMAHYDSVPAAPGAGDNGAAVAALLEVARALHADGPYRNSILFAFTDGEEPALLGAHALFDQHPWKDRIEAVINLEGSGSSGLVNLLRVGPGSGHLVRAFREVAPHPVANSLVEELFKLLPNNTDFNLALEAGYPGIDFAFAGDRHHYHTPLDSLANLEPGTVQHHGDNVLPLTRHLASLDLSSRADNFVYTTVQNRAWLSWPIGASIPLTVAAALLLGAAAVLIRRTVRPLRLLRGVGAGFVVMAAVVAFELLALAAIDAVAGTRVAWPASPWPWRFVIYGSAVLGMLSAGGFFASRLGFWDLHLGGWLLWTLIAAVLAAVAPLASNVLLVPALLSAVVTLIGALPAVRNRRLSRHLASTLCLAWAGYWMVSITYASEATTGFTDAAAMYAPLALLAAVSMPLLQRGGAVWAGGAVAAGCVIGGIIAPLAIPLYSPERPQHLNIRYVADADGDSALWLIDSPNPVPDRMRALGDIKLHEDPQNRNTQRPGMPAPHVPVPPPELLVAGDTVRAGERVLSLELRSARQAPVLHLELSTDASISGAGLSGQTLNLSGGGTFAFHDPPEAGLRLHLTVPAGEDGLVMEVWDSSYGLPDAGKPLLRARGALGTPIQRGDVWTVRRRVEL